LSPQLEKIASLEHTGPGLDDLALNPGLRARLDCLQSLGDGSALPPTFFWGRAGSGKAVVAAVLAKKKGRGLLTVDAAMLALQPPEKVQDLLHEAAREALLIQAVLPWPIRPS
jgi:replication-associated recombination protein RarA